MAQLSSEGTQQMGIIIGYFVGGAMKAIGASLVDELIGPKLQGIYLQFLDIVRLQPLVWSIVLSYEKPFSRVVAFVCCTLWLTFAVTLYVISFKEGHLFLIFVGLELNGQQLLDAWDAYLAADVSLGEELMTYTRMWYAALWYWITAAILIYWSTFTAVLSFAFLYICLPTVLLAAMIGFLIRHETAHGVSRTKDFVWYLLGKVLMAWSRSLMWIWDTCEVSLAYSTVRIPQIIGERIAKAQKARHAKTGMPFYQYNTLREAHREIRLLEIEPGTFASGMIKANMKHTSIECPLPYEALSYRWGDPTFSEEMLIDGKRFAITKAAYHLLRAQRSRYKPRLVWCDAICINQKDDAEKSHQVRMMREIYQNAKRVVVWMGVDWTGNLATTLLLEIFGAQEQYQGTGRDFYKFFFNDRYSIRWAALLELFRNEYLNRIWCVQEVAVGQSVHLLHGGMYIPWEIFGRVMMWCIQDQVRPLLEPRPSEATTMWNPTAKSFENAATMILLRRGDSDQYFASLVGNQSYYRFENLMFMCHTFQATNPSDKIFALVGMASNDVHELLRPNYAKSTSDVYIDAAEYVIQFADSPTHILGLAGIGYKTDIKGLPSWVPDLSLNRPNYPLTNVVSEMTLYQASVSLPAVRLTNERGSLSMKGRIIDSILDTTDDAVFIAADDNRDKHASQNTPTFVQSVRARLIFYNAVIKLIDNNRQKWSNSSNLDDILCVALIGDRIEQMRLSEHGIGRGFAPRSTSIEEIKRAHTLWVQMTVALSAAQSIGDIENMSPGELDKLVAPFSEDQGLVMSYGTALLECSYGRRFCITGRGTIALVPPLSRKGDVVALVHGAQTPFVLRKKEGRKDGAYELVGEGYFHGYMDGQASNLGEEEDLLIV